MAWLDEQLTRLAILSSADLRAEWRETFGEDAPSLSPSLLRRALAHHSQVQSGWRAVRGYAADIGVAGNSGPLRGEIQFKPGTRLLREGNGTVHSVLVTTGGPRFGDRDHGSLSQIPQEITGAHWSGPRFFGLNRRINPPARGSAARG